jgi:hypothetical protein
VLKLIDGLCGCSILSVAAVILMQSICLMVGRMVPQYSIIRYFSLQLQQSAYKALPNFLMMVQA